MNASAPKVFYDASCALCNAEIGAIRAVAPPGALEFVDCSAPGFDDAAWRAEGVTREAMMQALHVRTGEGTWHTGVASFVLLYERAGLPAIARLWGHPLLRGLLDRLYPWVVRRRHWLRRAGLPRLLERLIRFHARRAARASQRCAAGSCSL